MILSAQDQQIIKAIGLILLERIKALGMVVPESSLESIYDQALEEYKTILAAHDTNFEGTPELKQAVLDDVRYFLESRRYLK